MDPRSGFWRYSTRHRACFNNMLQFTTSIKFGRVKAAQNVQRIPWAVPQGGRHKPQLSSQMVRGTIPKPRISKVNRALVAFLLCFKILFKDNSFHPGHVLHSRRQMQEEARLPSPVMVEITYLILHVICHAILFQAPWGLEHAPTSF